MPGEVFTADVKLTPILKEYIVTRYGSDTIRLGRYDALSSKVKYLLRTNPVTYMPVKDRRNYIRIVVPGFRLMREPNKRIHGESRNYLSSAGQKTILNELNLEFKTVFHNYVLAYLRGGIINRQYFEQKAAIEDFCQTFQLRLTAINYEMLKKSWDRSHQKQMYMNSIKLKHFFEPANA